MTRNRGGLWVPVELGQGKFARVLCGQQQIGNQPARSVAIKILHSHATLAHERLFATEIAHLRKLSDADNVNVLHILDVLQLRPLVLCGCGKVYSPLPQLRAGAADPRRPRRSPRAAMHGLQVRPAGQPRDGPRAGALVGDRAHLLPGQGGRGQGHHHQLRPSRRHRDGAPDPRPQGLRPAPPRRSDGPVEEEGRRDDRPGPRVEVRVARAYRRPAAEEVAAPAHLRAVRKALLLEKVLAVVQLVEGVAWLHGEKRIIHKDLAADNIMVRFSGVRNSKSNWRGEHRLEMNVSDILNDITGYPTFRTLLIDFGLADESTPTRSWYDDDEATGQNKGPFLSPEAKNRRQDVGLDQPLAFSPEEKTFVIPRRCAACRCR
ncbi:protein kinase [Nannocystis pusilla]|uniref:protein kinase n=1 Tax=Nannocystis pusilla TaxID=889268 RepID=UPI003B7C3F56